MWVRISKPVIFLVALTILFGFSVSSADEAVSTPAALADAFTKAKEQSTFVLVDAFTTWCGPCKQFQEDYKAKSELRESLAGVVFISIDLEDSTSVEFKDEYPVSSVPQFILLDPDGVEHGRISGYGGTESFMADLEQLLENPIALDEYLASARADEGWEGPITLAKHHAGRREYEQAAPYFVEGLQRGAPGENRLDLLWATLVGLREGWSTVDEARAVAEQALNNPAETDRYWYRLYNSMSQVAEFAKDDSLRHPYLERAVEEAKESGKFQENIQLRIDYAHYVLGDFEMAAHARRDGLEYYRDPYSINIYVWYCFEHRVCLEEAEKEAREGVVMEGDPAHVAMLTDTLAELVYLRGETAEALSLVEHCIELDPDNEYYHNQEKRFRGILDGGGDSK